jgi:N-acetylglucosaminyldiphosphoundecaprenol N-acetyl-beta-D-mannosaminyltransferase
MNAPITEFKDPQNAFEIAGVRVDAVTLDEVVSQIGRWIKDRERRYIVLIGAHGIVEAQESQTLRQIHSRADLATSDGVPITWFGRARGFKVEQVCASNLMPASFSAGVKDGHKHFFCGGKPGVAERLADRMSQTYPGLQVAGTCSPPFRTLTAKEKVQLVRRINSAGPDIVWIGLGCPKQEYFIGEFRPRLTASVMVGVGAGFDFLSGEKKRAQRWISSMGCEWLFRAMTEGKRLRLRYRRVVVKVLPLLAKQLISSNKR